MPFVQKEAKKTVQLRGARLQKLILKTALKRVFDVGFRGVTVESIAAETGVGKTTIYRHWPNKAAVIMAAFLMEVEPITIFPPQPRAIDTLRLQMRSQVRQFGGKYGVLIRALIGEAQVDPDMAKAFREQWIIPRRGLLREVIEMAQIQGDFRDDIDFETAMDMIYAPVYFRLLAGHAPLSEYYVDTLLEEVRKGLGSRSKV
jgi:AcrR family transcriptional regulator